MAGSPPRPEQAATLELLERMEEAGGPPLADPGMRGGPQAYERFGSSPPPQMWTEPLGPKARPQVPVTPRPTKELRLDPKKQKEYAGRFRKNIAEAMRLRKAGKQVPEDLKKDIDFLAEELGMRKKP